MSSFIEKVKKYLVPPGQGVHTVHTASEFKEQLYALYYQTQDAAKAQSLWEKSLANLSPLTPIVFGICSDCGGGIQRGANWGPLFLRSELSKTTSSKYFDIGDVKVIPHLLHDKYLNDKTMANCRKALYHDEASDLPVSPLSMVEHFCESLWQADVNYQLLSLGGDHSVSYPLVKHWLKSRNAHNIKAAVIHFDAHTDLLDERLGVDICFGSWAYHILPYLANPSHLVQLGIRSSGKPKEFWQKQLGVRQYWPADFKQLQLSKISKEIIANLKGDGIQELYISCDIDALDASYANATGTPEVGGLEPHQIIYIISELAKNFKVSSCDLVEVAPFVKPKVGHSLNPEPQTTLSNGALILNSMLEAMNLCQ